MTTRPLASLCALTVAALAGCALGPDYERPDVPTPAAHRGAAPSGASLADQPWWDVFEDERLKGLIHQSLVNNYDVRLAATRVEEAVAGIGIARADLLPQAGYEGQAGRGQNAFLGRPFPGDAGVGGSFLAALNVSWELDVWGRLRRATEAARAELLAAEEAQRAVWLSLVSEVARAYFELLALDLELEIARRTTESFRRSLQLFTARLRGGVGSRLETARAEGALADAAATIPRLEIRITLKENQLNRLLGRPPGPVPRSATLLGQRRPPAVPSGLPSQLVERRPDVRESEQRLIAANADIGAAVASFFPRFGLTALAGAVSDQLRDAVTGKPGVWSVAGSFTGPLFQGGRLVATYEQTQARLASARLRYQQTVLVALHEVSDALLTRTRLEEVQAEQERAVAALGEAVRVATERYSMGQSSYFEVLEAQQQLFPAETRLARTELDRLLVIVELYRALGGGWNLADPDWIAPR